MSFLTRFYSAFPGRTMNLSPGGGTITEVGGVLTVSVALGVDGDWANNVAPIAWSAVHDKHYAFDTVFKFEGRMYSFTASGGEARGGLAFYKDQDNGYEFGFYEGDDRLYVTRWMTGSGGNVAQTGSAVTVPSTSPHTYRIYWNPSSRPLYVEESDIAFTITGNSVSSGIELETQAPGRCSTPATGNGRPEMLTSVSARTTTSPPRGASTPSSASAASTSGTPRARSSSRPRTKSR